MEEKKKIQLPEDLVFLNVETEKARSKSKNEAKTLINQTKSKLLMLEKRH